MCNTDSIKNGAGNANCESEHEIAVQVTGLEHAVKTQYQSLKLQHFEGEKEASKLLKSNSNEEVNKKTSVPSTIFKWDKKAQAKSGQTTTLFLEIEAEKGESIKLPLTKYFNPKGSSPDIDRYYLANRLYAIQPVVDIGNITGFYLGNRQENVNILRLAPARIGYFYIFMNGQLWRELIISRDDKGSNLYQDINVEQYRIAKDNRDYLHYKEGEREATGKKLEDIWVPGAFYHPAGTATCVVRMIYSDVQLSAARLTYLEENLLTLNQRSATFNWNTKYPDKSYIHLHNRPSLEGHALSLVTNMIKVRGRDESIEFLLDNPKEFLLKEDYLSTKLEATKNFDNNLQKTGYSYVLDNYESNAWQYKILSEKETLTEDEKSLLEELKELWEGTSEFNDVSERPKKRGIFGVLVSDINYVLTHHKYRLQDAVQTFVQLVDRAKGHEYSSLATFIEKQRALIKPFDEGVKDDIRQEGKIKYYRAIALKEREKLHAAVAKWKQNISIALQQPYAVEIVADHLSCYSNKSDVDELTDFTGKYAHFVESLFLAVQTKEQYDPLATPTLEYSEDYYKNSPEKFVFEVFTNTEHRLHSMLWPEVKAEDIESEYQPALKMPIKNMGHGLFNQELWEEIVAKDVLKNGKATTLTGTAFIGVAAYADQFPLKDETGVNFFKTTSNALYTLVGKWDKIVEQAKRVALQSRRDWNSAYKDFIKAEQDYQQKLYNYQQTAHKEEMANKHLESYRNKLDQCNKRLNDIDLEFQKQLESAKVVRAKVIVPHIQMVRMASGGKLYNLQYSMIIDQNNVPKGYRILGDVTTNIPKATANKATTVKRSRLSILENNKLLMNSHTTGARKFIYVAIMPENDPYIGLRDKAVREEIPKLQAHQANFETRIHHIGGNVSSLQQARALAETAEQSSAATFHDTFHTQDRMGMIYRLRRSQAIAYQRLNNVAQRIQRSGVVPPILLLFEVRNLAEIISKYDQTVAERGMERARAGAFAAGGDTIMAALVVVEELQANFYLAQKTPIPKGSFVGRMRADSKLLALFGIKGAAKLVPLGGLAILNIILSAWDTADAFMRGDGAFWGNLALTAAGFAMLFGLFAEGTSPVLTLGPMGWFAWAIGLTIAAIVLFIFFSDSDIEQWFKVGPFGSGDPKLKDEQTAFAALLNLITLPEVVVTNNPYQEIAKKMLTGEIDGQQPLTAEDRAFVERISKANTCISLNSGFMNFLQNDVGFLYEIMLYKVNSKTTIIDNDEEVDFDNTYTACKNEKVIEQEETNNGLMLFVYSPPVTNTKYRIQSTKPSYIDSYYNERSIGLNFPSDHTDTTVMEATYYNWVVAAQVETTLSDFKEADKSFYFPAPPYQSGKTYVGKKPVFPDTLHNTSPLNNPLDTIKADFWLVKRYHTGAITR